ncbi:GTPase IMAP family member 8-like [Littorina saxatilis]|uniref:GTPase IMAP family member 8-like n=1 Tax=Littorina saxatilis TaxID=31220 RepID=UPI0038B57652
MAQEGDGTGKKPLTTLLILGKAGNGKSSTANSILGLFSTSDSSPASPSFDVSHSFISNNLECQTKECNGIRVVCTPDLQHKKFINSELNKEKEVESWLKEIKGKPDAVILAIRCDQRSFDEEYDFYEQVEKNSLLKKMVKEKLVIVFTVGDSLNGRDLRQVLDSDNAEFAPLTNIWKAAKKRYVVFDNKNKNKNKIQVEALMNVVQTLKPHPFPQHTCRLLFRGSKATLGIVQSELGIKSGGFFGLRLFDHFDLAGLQLEVTFLCLEEIPSKALGKVKVAVSPGPHAILVLSDDNTVNEELELFSTAEKLTHASFCSSVRGTAEDVRKFLQVVDIKKLSNRQALTTLLEEEKFPARQLSGEFFHTAELDKIAKDVCEKTMRRTETPGEPAGSSYDTYLSVKREMVA